MTSNRMLTLLVVLTLCMQVALFVDHWRQPATPTRPEAAHKAPAGTTVDITDLPSRGNQNARVALIEFSDFECPFCARHVMTVLLDLQRDFIDKGLVRYVMANNPLPIHKNAQSLAIAATCAAQQNRFWEVHDVLFEEHPSSKEELMSLAPRMGLKDDVFSNCMESEIARKTVERQKRIAADLNLEGTPSFALGSLDNKGHVTVRTFIMGAYPIEVFEKEIRSLL